MKSKNYISGNSRKVNNFRHSGANEEGVFKTNKGIFIVKVKKNNRIVTLNQFEKLDEAISAFKEFHVTNV